MSTQTHLHAVANSARQLLDCEQVSLYLYCPDALLRHPLIALFRIIHPSTPLFYGSALSPHMLLDESMWTICDLSLRTGQSIIAGTWLEHIKIHDMTIGSAMIVALERPAGIIGFLFCSSRQTDAFKEGEQRLLTQYRPLLAELVERIVSESCLPASEGENVETEIQEQSAFLSLISHELRAPLMAIKGYSALLQAYSSSEKMSEAQKQRYLAVIMQQVKHLEVLIGDTLDVSHIQTGRLALHCTSLDVQPLFQYIVQSMQYRIDQQHPGRYCILCTVDEGLPHVWADADRVQQILTNLVENAIKYSPDGGLIEIQACATTRCGRNCPCQEHALTPAFVCITVRDQGIGIPRQQQATLFKPFTRLEHSATRHVSGSGLGLYIARKFIEAMHGQVMLRSSEGQGTDITFTLPLAPLAKNRAVCYSVEV